MAITISDKDTGFKKIMSEMKKLESKPYVKIGVQGADASKDKKVRNDDGTITDVSGITVVDIATFHEFGYGVPERSFLRATIDQNRDKYYAIVKELKNEIFAGKMTTENASKILGEKIKSDCQQRITDGIDPPLSSETIANKGSSVPLIDTGQLRQSITYVVEAKS
jgi:hypothetical protein